jgi:hypothetical protein
MFTVHPSAGFSCMLVEKETVRHIRQHTSAYVSIRQHTYTHVSIRQHTSAYSVTCELVYFAYQRHALRHVVREDARQAHTKWRRT